MENKDGFIKKVIISMAIFLLIFTIVMTIIYIYMGDVPESLIVAVFAACLGEGSITGVIQKAKIQKSNEDCIVEDEIDDESEDLKEQEQ